MKRTKKQKNHIFFYDPELRKKLNEIKKSEDLTWDELLKQYLRLPGTDQLIRMEYDEIIEQLEQKYKNEDLRFFMSLIWNLIINAAHGEYDIKRLIYDIENDIRLKTYRKR